MDDELDPMAPVGAPRYERGRLVRGGTLVIAGSLLGKVIGVVPLAVLTRELAVTDLDVFSFGVGFAAFAATISDLGVDQIAVRELAKRPQDRDRILGGAMLAKGVAVTATLGVAAAVSLAYEPRLRVAALIATLAMLTSIPTTTSLALTAEVRLAAPTVLALVGSAVNAAVLVVAAVAGADPVVLLALQTAIQIVTGLVIAATVRRVLGTHPRSDRAEAVSLVRGALPLAGSTLAMVVFARIDQLLLAGIGDDGELARYAVAVRAVDTFNVLAVAVVTVALPTLSHLVEVSSGRSRRLAERGFRYLAAAILPIAAVGTVVAGPVLGFAFGETFSASGAPAAILLWAHWSAFAWLLARSVLIAGDRTGVLAGLAVAAAAVNVALNLVLIPDHGAEGAAVASLVAYATPLVVGLWVPASRPVFTAAVRAGVRPVAAALVVLAALYAMDRAGVPAIGVVAAAAVVAPVAVLATRALTIGEVRELAVSSLRRQGGRR